MHRNYFSCKLCKGGVFKLEKDLIDHMSIKHPSGTKYKSSKCDECDFEGENRQKLIKHKIVIHDKSVHECHICNKQIIGKGRFGSHVDSHRRENCDLCGKMVGDLKLHIYTVHPTEDQKKFNCETCGKGFALKRRLRDHTMIHTDEKSFLCRFGCGFGSKTPGNRTKHEIHKHKATSEKEIKEMFQSQSTETSIPE